MESKIGDIDQYIETFDDKIKIKLYEIRSIIKKNAPKAIEKISWAMPTFWQEGNVCHFAAFKNHIGFYPGSSGIENFLGELGPYKNSKGAIQFPLDKLLPEELISRIVKFRVEENLEIANKKKSKEKKV